jgi:hypothetical protein
MSGTQAILLFDRSFVQDFLDNFSALAAQSDGAGNGTKLGNQRYFRAARGIDLRWSRHPRNGCGPLLGPRTRQAAVLPRLRNVFVRPLDKVRPSILGAPVVFRSEEELPQTACDLT